jgi:hypothetical protein
LRSRFPHDVAHVLDKLRFVNWFEEQMQERPTPGVR